jgi:hypothetical protein
MSDFPIEDKPVPQGAETPLSSDADNGRTKGTDCDQNTLSFCRGPEVPASSQTSERGYTVSGVGVSVKPVDRRTIEGSTPGDFRAQAAPAVLPDNPAPRDGMRQAPAGKNIPSNLPTQSFPANPDNAGE